MMRHWITICEKYDPYREGPMAKHAFAYHGTPLAHIPSIARFGLNSNLRPKYSQNWSNGKSLSKKEARQYHLLYFTFEPVDWGVHHHIGPSKNIRFHLASLPKRVKWEEDDERPPGEYYAISSKEFTIPPQALEIQYAPSDGKLTWMPLLNYYQRYYDDDPDLEKIL